MIDQQLTGGPSDVPVAGGAVAGGAVAGGAVAGAPADGGPADDGQLTGGVPLLADRAAALAGLLAPLRERQTRWAAGELDDEPEDPAQVWAQPLVVRLERVTPPDRLAALSAAATASLSVLADPRASAEWGVACRTWIAGRIRKVARRARGAHWQAAAELPGVTVTVGDAQVRAFPPYPVAETPAELRRLQVSGTELPDLAAAPVAVPGAPVFWLNSGARMSAGKAMAQVGHASMLLAVFGSAGELAGWLTAGLPVTVRDADATRWARLTAGPTDPQRRYEKDGRVCVRDAGFTEVEPGTVTVVAEWAPR